MRIGLIGRTNFLIDTASRLVNDGHEITFIYTCKSEEFYDSKEEHFEKLSNDLNCPYFNNLNIEDDLPELLETNTEICVSINWLTILPNSVLNSFKFGILNAHCGDLPRFRGNACPNWAILNGEEYVGLCIHKMVEKLDSYITDIYNWLDTKIPKMFSKTIMGLENGNLTFQDQDNSIIPLHCFPRKPEDNKIHWASSTDSILKLVRASSHPFSGAFSFLNTEEQKVTVFRAKKFESDVMVLAVPGQICMFDDKNPIVATNDGLIELTEVNLGDLSSGESKEIIKKSFRNRLI